MFIAGLISSYWKLLYFISVVYWNVIIKGHSGETCQLSIHYRATIIYMPFICCRIINDIEYCCLLNILNRLIRTSLIIARKLRFNDFSCLIVRRNLLNSNLYRIMLIGIIFKQISLVNLRCFQICCIRRIPDILIFAVQPVNRFCSTRGVSWQTFCTVSQETEIEYLFILQESGRSIYLFEPINCISL